MAQVLHGVVALVYLRVVLAVLVYVGISQFHSRHDARGHPLLREEGDGDGVATVVQAEVGGVVRVVSGVHHPVYHVRPPVVEASEASLNACGAILRSKTQRVCLLGFEVFVALLRGRLIVEVGEGRQSERHVPRCRELPLVCGAVTQVHTGIEAEGVVIGSVAVCHHPEGGCEAS